MYVLYVTVVHFRVHPHMVLPLHVSERGTKEGVRGGRVEREGMREVD